MPPPRPLDILAPCLLLAAAPLAAQLPPLTVPRGVVRVDLGGRFDNWDKRYLNGTEQEAAGDFNRDPVDGRWLPGLASAEEQLRAVTGVQALALSLGRSSSTMLVNLGTESIGAAWGVTGRLTLFGTVPFVRVRVRESFGLDSTGATAGFNPADPVFGTSGGASQTETFLLQMLAALTALDDSIRAGRYDLDPARKALAQATLARGTVLRNGLEPLLTGTSFLPLAGSAAATALTRSIDSIRTRLGTDLGISGFTELPALPSRRMSAADFEGYATDPDGPIAGRPFHPPLLTYLGDIEVGAALAWLDRRPAPGARGGFTARSVLQGTVRLRTGRLDRPDAFFDLPTGDRQPDVQGDMVTDLAAGRLGARFTARFVLQLPGRQQRRLSPPDQPIADASTLALVERDPGEIVEGAIEPFLRIGPTIALVGGVRHWLKGTDTYRYVPGQPPIEGTDPEVLAIGSKENGTAVSAGLSFVHDGVRRDGTVGLPMDASFRWEMIARSTEGRVPVKQTVWISLRFYKRIF
ncbi:MAG TPA: hypothetical protein VGQ17_17530 [Gemmatimonadales bacterium]|jgi:hypothetical protein|nr:hypothetical protein [Gemmatimonadales bacterium]